MQSANRIFTQQRRGEGRKNTQPYDTALKEKIAREYLSKAVTYQALQDKYGMDGSLIQKWVKIYSKAMQSAKLPLGKTIKAKFMGRRKTQPEVPVNEYERLRRELEEAKLKNAALEKMIALAETELGIDIRKKYSTKQSNG